MQTIGGYVYKNNAFDYICIELQRTLIGAHSYGSNLLLAVRDRVMKKVFLAFASFIETRFHNHKRSALVKLDNNLIGVVRVLESFQRGHGVETQEFKKHQKLLMVAKSLQCAFNRKYVMDTTLKFDQICSSYQSPNQQWHRWMKDVEKLKQEHQEYLDLWLEYRDELNQMDEDEFNAQELLLSRKLHKKLPSFDNLKKRNDKVFLIGPLKRVDRKYKKSFKVGQEEEEKLWNAERDQLKSLFSHGVELTSNILKVKATDYCPHDLKQHGPMGMLYCTKCKQWVHIDCDRPNIAAAFDSADIVNMSGKKGIKESWDYKCHRCQASDRVLIKSLNDAIKEAELAKGNRYPLNKLKGVNVQRVCSCINTLNPLDHSNVEIEECGVD